MAARSVPVQWVHSDLATTWLTNLGSRVEGSRGA